MMKVKKNQYECELEKMLHTRIIPMMGNGNYFNAEKEVKRVAEALTGRKPECLYFGFNPVSYRGDIVVLTEAGYVFIPLDEIVELVGGVWSHLTLMRLFYAQERLSAFLTELGQALNIKVVDRCLYGAFIDKSADSALEECLYSKIENEYIEKKRAEFRDKYKEQLEEMKKYENWMDYHNQGFAFHYTPYVEVQKAENAIYQYRKQMEDKGCHEEVREANSVIEKLRKIIRTDRCKGKDSNQAECMTIESLKEPRSVKRGLIRKLDIWARVICMLFILTMPFSYGTWIIYPIEPSFFIEMYESAELSSKFIVFFSRLNTLLSLPAFCLMIGIVTEWKDFKTQIRSYKDAEG